MPPTVKLNWYFHPACLPFLCKNHPNSHAEHSCWTEQASKWRRNVNYEIIIYNITTNLANLLQITVCNIGIWLKKMFLCKCNFKCHLKCKQASSSDISLFNIQCIFDGLIMPHSTFTWLWLSLYLRHAGADLNSSLHWLSALRSDSVSVWTLVNRGLHALQWGQS